MNKNNYISIALFFFIFISGLIYLNKVFVTHDLFINTKNDFVETTKKNQLDILFIGSSYTYTSLNPIIIDNICRVSSFNLGSVSLRINLYDDIIKESLKYNKPKLLIVEVRNRTMKIANTKKAKGYQLIALDFISNLSSSKAKTIKEIFEPHEYLSVYSTLIRNHKKWHKSNLINLDRKVSINHSRSYYYKGFRGAIKEFDDKNKTYMDFRNIHYKKSTIDNFNNEVKDELLKISNFSKDNNIKLLLITPPYVKANADYYFFEKIKSFCDSTKINYLNLNNYTKEINLTIKDFQDLGHLNIYGSLKTSEFVADYLNNYDFIKDINKTISHKDYEIFLDNYKSTKELFFKKEENKEFINQIGLKSILINRNNHRFKIILEFENTKLLQKKLDKYNLAVHLFTVGGEKNKLILDKNLNSNIITIGFKSKLDSISKIDLFLYDRKGYNGVIGNKIKVNDIVFK